MTDENKIIELSRQGNLEAFSFLLRNYEKRLQKAAYILCSGEAEDLLQETYLAVFRSIRKFRGKSSFYTWMYRILLNLAYKRFRKNSQKSLLLKRFHRDSLNPTRQENFSAEYLWKEKVRSAVASLPLKYREVIMLYYFENLTVEQISEHININAGTVKSRLYNARGLLKKKLNLKEAPGN
jgi:RNA polymerase sigma factor (sigma-70 family)